MSVSLAWGFFCFTIGWLAHRWAYQLPQRKRRAQVETSPIDLRATLTGDVRIEELRQACFEEARRKR